MNYLTELNNYKRFNANIALNNREIIEMNSQFRMNNFPYYLDIENEEIQNNIKQLILENKSFNPLRHMSRSYYDTKIFFIKDKDTLLLYVERDNLKIVIGKFSFLENTLFYYNNLPRNIKEYLGDTVNPRMTTYPEWVFNYNSLNISIADFFQQIRVFREMKKCPVGLIPYLEENNLNLDEEGYNSFINMQLIKQLPQDIRNIGEQVLSFIIKYCSYNGKSKEIIEHHNMQLLIILIKLTQVSIKEQHNIFYLSDKLRDFMCIIEELQDDELKEIIDLNRGLEYNYKLIENHKNKELNKKIQRQQEKIKNFDYFELANGYICRIPINLQDLQDEGKQQNNCVGSFYNDDIIGGRNKICFIRNKNTPNKSYITCRIGKDGGFVEYRYKNNREVKSGIDLSNVMLLSMTLRKYYKGKITKMAK